MTRNGALSWSVDVSNLIPSSDTAVHISMRMFVLRKSVDGGKLEFK